MTSYDDLLALFEAWRQFERPGQRDGAPDYTPATFRQRRDEFEAFRERLAAIRPDAWPIVQQVDHRLVQAELDGYDFNQRVLQPWARDPAFYLSLWTEQSDTPAHEGPTHHAAIELWRYSFPLSAEAESQLARELRGIAPLLAQARGNLTGKCRDLWNAGIHTIARQAAALRELALHTAGAASELSAAIQDALEATGQFIGWLEQQAASKTEPSGVGVEAYSWCLRHVHLVPRSWQEEVTLFQRELARAHTALRLEEQRNRALPPLSAAASPEEYRQRALEAIDDYVAFLRRREVLAVRDYMAPAMRARIGDYKPEQTRDFFAMASHRAPLTLFTHFYHWWDLERMRSMPHPSPIRRGPLLYNIWSSRAEGMATSVEELMLHAGLFDDNPRAREIVWIMLAQRAARGLASLHAHANTYTMKQAADFHVAWTPRGWMREDLDLLGFEQHLYLRQPGYGTSYLSGKAQLDQLLMERAQQLGAGFSTARFFAEVDESGLIPVSMIHWELTERRSPIG